MKDEYLCLIKQFNRKRELIYAYPEEKLGVGDRMIFNKIIRDSAFQRGFHSRNKIFPRAMFCLDLDNGLREYGFKIPRRGDDLEFSIRVELFKMRQRTSE